MEILNTLNILVSVNDVITYELKLNEDLIEKILNKELDNKKEKYKEKLYWDSKKNEILLGQIVFNSYVNNNDIKIDLLKTLIEKNITFSNWVVLLKKIIG